MSADRTLMSVIRTSLSLIGFGFTIFQFFRQLHDAQVLQTSTVPRHFGEALVWLGITMLVVGMGYHIAFMVELRRQRQQMKHDGLIHAESRFPSSLTLIVAGAAADRRIGDRQHDVRHGPVRVNSPRETLDGFHECAFRLRVRAFGGVRAVVRYAGSRRSRYGRCFSRPRAIWTRTPPRRWHRGPSCSRWPPLRSEASSAFR